MESEKTIILHGGEWQLKHVEEEARHHFSTEWKRTRWFPKDEIKSKGGGSSTIYRGQAFDPEKQEIIKNGWDHDHCEICWWKLRDSSDEEENTGYFDGGHSWICTECYEKLILPNKNQA